MLLELLLWLQCGRICLQCGRPGFNPWVGKIPWRRERLPNPAFWPGEFHGLYDSMVRGVSKSRTWSSDFHSQDAFGYKWQNNPQQAGFCMEGIVSLYAPKKSRARAGLRQRSLQQFNDITMEPVRLCCPALWYQLHPAFAVSKELLTVSGAKCFFIHILQGVIISDPEVSIETFTW